MGRFSIRLKITIWFTAALVVIVLFAYLMIFVVSRQILIKTIQDSLVETVENNVDEIEYFSGMDEIRTDADIDYLIDYRKGYLEIDDDFLSKVNEVYTGLYDEKLRLIYGENPIAAKVADLEFVDSEIQKVMKDGTGYYIFDRKLTAEGLNGLWLRGVVSEEQGERQSFGIMRIALVLLPVLVVIASAGGYFIAGRTLNPIQKIARTARKIGEENDLKCRINLGKGNDELHQLADIFNEMFERLESTFEKEQQFTRESQELKMVEYLAAFVGQSFSAVISGVAAWGLYVRLDCTAEGILPVRALGDEYFVFDPVRYTLVGDESGKVYRLGQRVAVTLKSADATTASLEFVLAGSR